SDRGLETRLVPAAGFELLALSSKPIFGRSFAARAQSLPASARACLAAWRALGRYGADFAISVGGYASIPAVVAAALRRIPIALVEPNAIPGRANRAAARLAKRVFVQFDRAAEIFTESGAADRVRNTGVPLRESLLAAFRARAPRRAARPPFRLLVAGGSQGARQINNAMIEAAPQLDARRLEIFHQSGEADRERTERAYRAAGLRAEVVAFEPEMPARYLWADAALCRAGALTIAELALAGLPALLVPYPFAADDHQTANAAALVAAGAARLLGDNPLGGPRVVRALRELFDAPEQLAAMADCAAKLARPDAAACIVADCAAQLGR
ncbi:MAG TPA: UDP-N-acetylglucosamine--N-acetylmuramyl-(pentapeptide) pyrophosphoryl-undecaprenol N-acetylglucosamine transferase, partial [Myxococcota bacterium]|nr:UDP-N-acetylglucosamine--N-acetylmuramyl-(pentapeptide) pyrophosphoryl-undecaprenol N-acetylglucosamine transferase [Myxococcota bacterium]